MYVLIVWILSVLEYICHFTTVNCLPSSSSHHHPQTNVTKRIMWVDDIDIGPARSLLAPNSNIVSSDGVNLCHNHHHHNHHHHHHHHHFHHHCHHHQPSFPVRIFLVSDITWKLAKNVKIFLVSVWEADIYQCWRNISLYLNRLEQRAHLIEKMQFLSLSRRCNLLNNLWRHLVNIWQSFNKLMHLTKLWNRLPLFNEVFCLQNIYITITMKCFKIKINATMS